MSRFCPHVWSDQFLDADDQWHGCGLAPGHDAGHRCVCGARPGDTGRVQSAGMSDDAPAADPADVDPDPDADADDAGDDTDDDT